MTVLPHGGHIVRRAYRMTGIRCGVGLAAASRPIGARVRACAREATGLPETTSASPITLRSRNFPRIEVALPHCGITATRVARKIFRQKQALAVK